MSAEILDVRGVGIEDILLSENRRAHLQVRDVFQVLAEAAYLRSHFADLEQEGF